MTSKLNKTLPEFPWTLGDPQIIDSADNYYLVESFKVYGTSDGIKFTQDKRFNIIERVDNPGVASDGSPQYWYNKLVMRGGRQDSIRLSKNRSRALYKFKVWIRQQPTLVSSRGHRHQWHPNILDQAIFHDEITEQS